jgi:hypothetical protein
MPDMEEKKSPEEKKGTDLPKRSCILFLIAGAYLIYTGYTLIQGKLTGSEGASTVTAVFGGGFIVAAVVMIVMALRSLSVLKKQEEEEERREDSAEELPEASVSPDNAENTDNAENPDSSGDPEGSDLTEEVRENEDEGQDGIRSRRSMSISERARLVKNLGDDSGSEEE